MDLLKELDVANDNKLEVCLEAIRGKSKIVLFGAGESGNTISRWLLENGIDIVGFVDSNPAKIGTSMNGIPVRDKKELTGVYKGGFIVISCGDYAVILEELHKYGIKKEDTLYIDPKWIRQPDGLKNYIVEHISEYKQAYDLLEDDKSRSVFLNMLKYKVTYDVAYIESVCDSSDQRYFDKEIMRTHEVQNYVDAGGYTGDTAEEFIKKFGGYEDIYVFEPNSLNFTMLNDNLKKYSDTRMQTYNMGLSDKEEELIFDISSGIATRIDHNGTEKIKCNCLDNIIKDRRVDLIKMDIEGSEKKALEGSRQIIQKYHPILAICVYHKVEDFYEIPMLIHKILPEYKLYFRQYELSDTETICYARC